MSTTEADKPKRPQSNRRRRPQGGKRTEKSESTSPKSENGEQSVEKPAAPKKERSAVVPPSAEMFGQRVKGFVNTVIKKGKLNFGFLSIGSDESAVNDTTPRIYFNPSCVAEEGKVILRRGYAVEFNVEKDEKDRPTAKDIKLTEEGAKTREEREATISQKRAERAERPAAPKKEKAPATEAPVDTEARKEKRQRKRPEGRTITLKVKSEGSSEEKTVEINVNQNIGRLKVLASKELGVSAEASVYSNGEFLTKAILRKLNDNDTIVLGPKKESTTA